jgi:hypothetical protein
MVSFVRESISSSARAIRAASIVTCLALGSACGSGSQPPKTAADQYAFVERTRCMPEDDDKQLAPVLSGEAVAGVRPLYSNVEASKSGLQAELRGARLTVRALPGVTPEWLDRALECHGAKAMLGHVTPPANDPFFVPNAFVDVDVFSEKDGFEVQVIAYSPADAKQVLDRANAFGATSKPAPSAP